MGDVKVHEKGCFCTECRPIAQVKGPKKQVEIDQEIAREVKAIIEDFEYFTTGYRALFLIHRNKEGGGTNNTKVKKIIVNGTKEYQKALEELMVELYEAKKTDIPYRIYASINPRDMDKAIRLFKYEQLDADYLSCADSYKFYLDIKNRFLGCLMQPKSKDGSEFLFDIDTDDNSGFLKALPEEVEVVKMYKTKNGWHAITKPFNHTKMVMPQDVSLQTDGLLLLKY